MMLLLTYSLDKFKYLSHFLSKCQVATSTPIVNCNSKTQKKTLSLCLFHTRLLPSVKENLVCVLGRVLQSVKRGVWALYTDDKVMWIEFSQVSIKELLSHRWHLNCIFLERYCLELLFYPVPVALWIHVSAILIEMSKQAGSLMYRRFRALR